MPPSNDKADGSNPNNRQRRANLENQIAQLKAKVKPLQQELSNLETQLRDLPK